MAETTNQTEETKSEAEIFSRMIAHDKRRVQILEQQTKIFAKISDQLDVQGCILADIFDMLKKLELEVNVWPLTKNLLLVHRVAQRKLK